MSRDSHGCGLISLNNKNLLELTEKIDNFQLSVRFSEEVTGTQGEASWGGSLVDKPFNLAVSGPESAMVGLPYTGEITLTQHDGTPMTEEPVSVCVSLYGDISEVKEVLNYFYRFDEEEMFEALKLITKLRHSVVCQNVTTTSPEGKIKFFVPLDREIIPAEVKKMIIRATSINYPSNNITKMVQPTRSGYISYKAAAAPEKCN